MTSSATVAAGASTSSMPAGIVGALRSGQLGDLIVSQLHGNAYEPTYRNNSFYAAIQAVATTTVGLATTYTGLAVSNPVGSNINMVLRKASVMQSVIQATQPEAYAIAVGYHASTNVTHTAALTVRNNKIGSAVSSVGLADTSATLPAAPFYHTFVQNTGTAIANGTGSVIDLDGSVILIPGAFACWVSPAQASVAGLWFSFAWEEVPV